MTLADRPDIRKKGVDFNISFRDAKKLLYKFLFLCDLKFEPDVRLNLEVTYPVKRGSVTQFNLALANLNYYTVTAELKSFAVNNSPVYIVMIPCQIGLLPNRHRAKLEVLKEQYNIVIFDSNDLHSVGVKVAEDKWIKPLDKLTLKKWIELLYSKIKDLGGVVHSRTSYGKVVKYIEAPDSAHFNPLVKKLNTDTLKLKSKLLLENLPSGCTSNPDKLVKEFVKVPSATCSWWSGILKSLKNYNTRDECLQYLKSKYNIEDLGYCFYKIINPKTFDYMVLSIHEVKNASMPHRVSRSPYSVRGIAVNLFISDLHFSYKISRYSRKKVLGYIETEDLTFLDRKY